MPTAHQQLKLLLLLLVIGTIVMKSTVFENNKLFLHPKMLIWSLFYAFLGLFFILIGLISARGAEGALSVGTVYALWPLVFTFLICSIGTEKKIDALFKTLVLASLCIGLSVLIIVLHTMGYFPDCLYVNIFDRQDFDFGRGSVSLHYKPMESLLFLVPFLVAAVFTWRRRQDCPVPRRWLWIALSFGVITVVISSRNALLFVVMLSIPLTLLFHSFMPRRQKKYNLKLFFFAVLGVSLLLMFLNFYLDSVYSFNFHSLLDGLMRKFDFQGNPSAILRRDQFFALWDGFLQNPFFGAGHGASVDYVRSDKAWVYELSYVALLFQVGVFGFMAYLSGIFWIYWMGIRLIRKGGKFSNYMVPTLVGMTCFLIANATNQYLAKFDSMWVVFLPVALINYALLCKPDCS